MLSYKKWKKINENFGVNLGVKTPNKINSLHSKWDEMGVSMPMMKKSKKMFGGDDGPDMGSGPDDGAMGGDAPPFMKKKGKGKKPPFPPHGGDEDMGDEDMGPEDDELDADMDGDDLGHDDDDMGDDAGDGPESDMGNDEEAPDLDDMGDDDADMGDDADMDDDMGDDDMGDDAGPGVGGPDDAPPALKKKGGSFIDKTKSVADGAKMMHKGASKMIKGMKENKGSRKMTKEETEFFRSLQSQTGSCKFALDDTGSWSPVTEDSIIPPSDPNANIVDDDEAGPGEPGYAPQSRVGGSFSEWAAKYQRKSKINESKRK